MTRFRNLTQFSLFMLLILAAGKSYAVECTGGSVVRCLCKASMQLSCDDGTTGWVDNSDRPTSIKVSVMTGSGETKAYVVNNPPKGIRSYYGFPDKDPFIIAALAKQGVKLTENDKVTASQATYSKTPTLYEDHDGLRPLSGTGGSGGGNGSETSGGNIGANTVNPSPPLPPSKPANVFTNAHPKANGSAKGLTCSYQTSPTVISGGSCGESLCSATVSCFRAGKKLGTGMQAACKAKYGGRCPSATECAQDDKIKIANATGGGSSTSNKANKKETVQ